MTERLRRGHYDTDRNQHMKYILLIILAIALGNSCIAQGENVDKWDNALLSKMRGKLKKVVIGNRGTGTAIFYYKSNRSISAIVKREEHGYDSVTSFSANFQNDTLFRVTVTRNLRSRENGSAIIYLAGDKIIDQKTKGTVYLPATSNLIDSAYKMLDYAKGELLKQFN